MRQCKQQKFHTLLALCFVTLSSARQAQLEAVCGHLVGAACCGDSGLWTVILVHFLCYNCTNVKKSGLSTLLHCCETGGEREGRGRWWRRSTARVGKRAQCTHMISYGKGRDTKTMLSLSLSSDPERATRFGRWWSPSLPLKTKPIKMLL